MSGNNKTKAHWLISEHKFLDCTNCGKSYYTGIETTMKAKEYLANGKAYNYCPYCGAYMKGEVE